MWAMFDHFPKIVTKSKGQLGDLLDTINHFVMFDKQGFAAREASIRVFAQIIEQAMFTLKIAPDCEGAVACQLLFQSLAGTAALDALLEPLLDLTTRRMQADPTPLELKKHLIGIFMAAMYYNAPNTLRYLESRGMTGSLVEEMCTLRAKFTAEYERRFFIIGLTRMLKSPELPVSLQPQLLRLLNELVETITSLHDQVTKRVKAQAEAEAKIDDSDDDEDSDDDDEDDEEEEDRAPKRKSAATGEDGDEEIKESAGESVAMTDDQLGLVEKVNGAAADDGADDGSDKDLDNAESDATDDDSDDELDQFVSQKFTLR